MNKPDWKAFGEAIIGEWPGLYDIDASEVFEAALKHNIVFEIPGGYDPDQHTDAHGVAPEVGDPWYEFNKHSMEPEA